MFNGNIFKIGFYHSQIQSPYQSTRQNKRKNYLHPPIIATVQKQQLFQSLLLATATAEI